MTELNPLIHAPKRLRLMAILSTFDHVTFARLQDRLELSAPDLSKQLKALQEPGYVTMSKTGRGPGSQTWVSMTRSGMNAYNSHVAALREVLDGVGGAAGQRSDWATQRPRGRAEGEQNGWTD